MKNCCCLKRTRNKAKKANLNMSIEMAFVQQDSSLQNMTSPIKIDIEGIVSYSDKIFR